MCASFRQVLTPEKRALINLRIYVHALFAKDTQKGFKGPKRKHIFGRTFFMFIFFWRCAYMWWQKEKVVTSRRACMSLLCCFFTHTHVSRVLECVQLGRKKCVVSWHVCHEFLFVVFFVTFGHVLFILRAHMCLYLADDVCKTQDTSVAATRKGLHAAHRLWCSMSAEEKLFCLFVCLACSCFFLFYAKHVQTCKITVFLFRFDKKKK